MSDPEITVVQCGPSEPSCVCHCIEGGGCGHQWDGPAATDGNIESATCSRCGMAAIDHDLWVLP